MTRLSLKGKTVVSAVMAAVALLLALTSQAGLAYADLDSDLAEADEAAGAAQETYEAAQAKQEELAGKLDSIN